MIVVDASAIVELLAPHIPDEALERRLLGDNDLHAPHLLDVEIGNALRCISSRGKLGSDRATDILLDVDAMPIARYPHSPLLPRAWELRHNLTIYDGVYVALAEALDAPLVSCDVALAGAPGIQAEVELYPRAR